MLDHSPIPSGPGCTSLRILLNQRQEEICCYCNVPNSVPNVVVSLISASGCESYFHMEVGYLKAGAWSNRG